MAKKKLSFIPQSLDLSLYAGDGAGIRFTITDSTGAALPLTGEMKAEIRANREDADPALATFAVDLTDSATGIVLISLTGEQTHSLITNDEKFIGVWDLEWTPTGVEPRLLFKATWSVILMSLTDSQIIDVSLQINSPDSVDLLEITTSPVTIVAGNTGPRGPQGEAGQWEALTQSEYDLLNPPDPDTLYVIIQ